jgi:hypothetical protein
MQAYNFETIISKDGKIILPAFLKRLLGRKVEIFLFEKKEVNKENHNLNIPTYKCGGKIADFNRDDLYENRI